MVVVIITTLLTIVQFSSLVAILATTHNQRSGARMTSYFVCHDVMSSCGTRPITAYGMSAWPSFWPPKTEPDISGNNNVGWLAEFR